VKALCSWLLVPQQGEERALSELRSVLSSLQAHAPTDTYYRGVSPEVVEEAKALLVVRCGVELLLEQLDAYPDDCEIDFEVSEEWIWGDHSTRTVAYVLRVAQWALGTLDEPPITGREPVDPELLTAIRDQLVPWLLG
jgi:hypothetical protein